MNNKRVSILSAFFLLFLLPHALAEDRSKENQIRFDACSKNQALRHSEALTVLSNLEDDYVKMVWEAKKTWEYTYDPWWNALDQTREAFSPDRQAEGQVLVNRYEDWTKSAWRETRLRKKSIDKNLLELIHLIDHMHQCCATWAYQNCLARWQENVLTRIESLRTYTDRVYNHLKKINAQVRSTLKDNISDHGPLGNRLAQELETWNMTYDPEVLKLLRLLQESFDIDLVGQECCEGCTEAQFQLAKNSQSNPLNSTSHNSNRNATDYGGPTSDEVTGASLKSVEDSVKTR